MFATAASEMTRVFADDAAAVYTDPDTKETIELTAIVMLGKTETRVGQHGTLERVRHRSIQVLDSQLDHTEIKQWGTITVGGVVYGITHIAEPQGGLYQLDLEAIAPAEMGRRGLRKANR
jgi:hypothetical protein